MRVTDKENPQGRVWFYLEDGVRIRYAVHRPGQQQKIFFPIRDGTV